MDPSLVELITEMVMAELSRSGSIAPARPPEGGARKLVLAAAPGAGPEVWAALAKVPGASWLGVGALEEAGRHLALRAVPVPGLWDDLVAGAEAVVLPAFGLEQLAKLALLVGDQPAVAAALAGIVQGVPVLANGLEVERIRRHSARLPAGFLQVFQSHLRTVEGMGVQFLEPQALAERLGNPRARALPAASKGRDVVTVEDLEAARRQGVARLELASGTIVTPLARDAAKQMGIEVIFR